MPRRKVYLASLSRERKILACLAKLVTLGMKNKFEKEKKCNRMVVVRKTKPESLKI